MKIQEYTVKKFSHDDTVYKFKYRLNKHGIKRARVLSVPVNSQYLSQFRTNKVYTSFMSYTLHHCKKYNIFAGVAHTIPDVKGKYTELPYKTREPPNSVRDKSSSKTRECSEYEKKRE